MSDSIENTLADVAEALRVPVFVLALLAAILATYLLGQFAIELARRYDPRRRRRTEALLAAAASGTLSVAALRGLPSRAATLCAQALFSQPHAQEHHEAALAAFELMMQRRLEPGRMLVRAGPALGLMGTLIPLAPGLGDLDADGGITELGDDLETAFAATIVGLAVGVVGFAITLVRTRLYAEDLHLLEQVARQLRASGQPVAAHA